MPISEYLLYDRYLYVSKQNFRNLLKENAGDRLKIGQISSLVSFTNNNDSIRLLPISLV